MDMIGFHGLIERFQIILLILFPITSTYEFKCPALSQRETRAKGLCPEADQYFRYSCLFDANNEKYVESCEEDPDFVRPGYKYVIRGIPTDAKCSLDIYQPYLFYLNESTNCAFLKSSCNGIGQLISANRTTKEDRTCRCDYGKGYDYFITPKDKCHCVPSEEDCSCYRKQCPINHRLSPDYDCIPTDSIQRTFYCTVIDSTLRTEHSTKHQLQNVTDTSGNFTQKYGYNVISNRRNMECVPLLVICLAYIGICITYLVFILPKGICTSSFMSNLPKDQLTPDGLERQIIGNWKLLKETLNFHTFVASFEKNGLMVANDVVKLNNYSQCKRNAYILILLLRNIKMEQQCSNCREMINEQGSDFKSVLNKPFHVRRWPKRDITKCSLQINRNYKTFCDFFNPEIVLDDFLQNLVFDIDDYEDIIFMDTKKNMVECFFKKLYKTFNKGSFECLLDILRPMETFSIPLRALQENLPPAVMVNTESGTIYSNCKGFFSMLMSIKAERMNKPVEFKPWKLSCDGLMWLVRELALYPHSSSSEITAILLLPLADDCCQRVHHSVKNGNFEEFLEQLFVEEIDSSFEDQMLEVNIIIKKEQPGAENIEETTYKRTPINIASFNVFTANRKFLEKHIDAKSLMDQCAKHGCSIFRNCSLDGLPENQEKLDRCLNVLESEVNSNLMNEFLKILDNMGYNKVANRLRLSQKVFNANTDKLPQKIMYNLSTLCNDLCDEFDEIISVFVERNILSNEIQDIKRNIQDEKCRMLLFIIHILKSGRDDAMLTLVEVLYHHQKHAQLAIKLLSSENDVIIHKDNEKVVYDTQNPTSSVLFEGKYKLSVLL